MVTRLQFLGATRTVTGSCFLVQHGHTHVLVDCGLIQGSQEMLRKNREPFAFDPTELKAVVLTNAHLDHTGLVPRLVEEGFRGPIVTTKITKDLLRIVWDDFARLQQRPLPGWRRLTEDEAPLYTDVEVERALSRCEGWSYDAVITLSPSIRIRFADAGHMLGSAIVEIWIEDLKVVFSGDLGHRGKPIGHDPSTINEADTLVLEGTYGDRNHKTIPATLTELAEVTSRTLAAGGSVLMPVSAVGRSQELLYLIDQITREGLLDRPRVFVDSPTATHAADVYARHLETFDEDAGRLLRHPPSYPEAPVVNFTESVEASRNVARESGVIILAGSGMCEGGRIQDHLLRYLDDHRSCVIFTGYQAEGTVGRRLIEGPKYVRIQGLWLPLKAQIHTINGLSALADQSGLLDWVGAFRDPKPEIYLVHGEFKKLSILASALRQRYRIEATIPEWREMALLSASGRRRSTRLM
jgi:metallo-beta-lactamase family protein